MDPLKRDFITKCSVAARMAAHPFCDMAACEAALESRWGQSQLAVDGNNLFGMKQHTHPTYGDLSLPTREFLGGEWTVVDAAFVKYPTLDDCFADRLATLTRLASVYPHYKAALTATDPESYVREVSQTWSTDPNRAAAVISIYHQYISDLTRDA
jgi:flagellum-specific peptidoglycan hydrolase FlgJ